MSFSLYNKYRPLVFKDFVGQNISKTILEKACDTDKIFHSILLVGPKGSGKTTIARIIALSINCENGSSSRPCLSCHSCLSIMNKKQIDIHEIDAASNNGVDDIRDLKRIISISSKLRYKVVIIDECHMMSKSAFNALLKTLEEPPQGTVIILATTEFNKVPDTIASRCAIFNFSYISVENIIQRLREISINEGLSIDEDALYTLGSASNGGMRDAINMLEKASVLGEGKIDSKIASLVTCNIDSKISNLMLRSFFENSIKGVMLITSALDKNNISPKTIFKELLDCLYSVYIYKISGSMDYIGLRNNESREFLLGLSDSVNIEKLSGVIEYLSGISNELEVNPNPKYFVDVVFYKAMTKYYN